MAYLGNIPLYFVTLVLYTLIKVLYFLFVYVILLKKKKVIVTASPFAVKNRIDSPLQCGY